MASVADLSHSERKDRNAPKLADSGRSRMGAVTGFELVATGSYVPETVVRNEDLAELGCDSDWIVQRTGIKERRRAAADVASSDLAFQAAERCLAAANTNASEVDLILVATLTPDHATPSTACHLQGKLGCIAPALDVNAACAGFMYALVTAGQFVSSGSSQCALVVGAEVMSRTVDPQDVKTYPLFGDGAGAALLRPSEQDGLGLISYTLGSESCGGASLCIPSGGSRMPLSPEAIADGQHFMRMEGRAVFKWAVRVVAESCKDCLSHANLAVSDIDLLILHQANARIIDSAVDDIGIDREKVVVNVDRYGNTSAASIPLALDEAMAQGRIKPGSRVMLSGFGGGLAWGTAILQV